MRGSIGGALSPTRIRNNPASAPTIRSTADISRTPEAWGDAIQFMGHSAVHHYMRSAGPGQAPFGAPVHTVEWLRFYMDEARVPGCSIFLTKL